MKFVSIVALGLLIVFDAAACGFRAAAGRSGLVEKRSYYRSAVIRGVAAGVFVCGVGMLLAWALAPSEHSAHYWSRLADAASRSLLVFVPFAATVVLWIGIWLIPNADVRTFATVTVLGPGTLLRPLVIVGGLVAGALVAPSTALVILGTYGALSMLLVERFLGRIGVVSNSRSGRVR